MHSDPPAAPPTAAPVLPSIDEGSGELVTVSQSQISVTPPGNGASNGRVAPQDDALVDLCTSLASLKHKVRSLEGEIMETLEVQLDVMFEFNDQIGNVPFLECNPIPPPVVIIFEFM